jgi:hypothetical protein
MVREEYPRNLMAHTDNWFQCMRSRAKPYGNIETGFAQAVVVVMANRSYRQSKKLQQFRTTFHKSSKLCRSKACVMGPLLARAQLGMVARIEPLRRRDPRGAILAICYCCRLRLTYTGGPASSRSSPAAGYVPSGSKIPRHPGGHMRATPLYYRWRQTYPSDSECRVRSRLEARSGSGSIARTSGVEPAVHRRPSAR